MLDRAEERMASEPREFECRQTEVEEIEEITAKLKALVSDLEHGARRCISEESDST